MRSVFKLLLGCTLVAIVPSAVFAQENPFGDPDLSVDRKLKALATASADDLKPTHPEGVTPQERINSLAHTDALPRCDRVDVCALSAAKLDRSGQSAKQRFPIRPYAATALIHASVIVKDADAEQVCAAWRSLTFDANGGAFCHLPVFGLRFYRDDQLLFETSVCWKCSNFYLPKLEQKSGKTVHGWYGFAGDQHASALLELLKSIVKHPDL